MAKLVSTNTIIREANNEEKHTFIDFTLALSRYNRANHFSECKYDAFSKVLNAQKKKLKTHFFYVIVNC